jgi:hypothetical protein
LASALLLSACTATPSGPVSLALQERLRNPLVAERYWSDMAEHMADFTRTQDPIMKDDLKAGIIDDARVRALARVEQARAIKKEGLQGLFKTQNLAEDTHGEALLLKDMLYFDTTFLIYPNPSVHVLLSTMVDPQAPGFPDSSALDLGELQTAYGAQQYQIPEGKADPGFRTVALYDMQLQRLIGFAQLSP